MNKEQEKELREKMLMKFVGITFHKKDIDWVIGGIKNLLKAQREELLSEINKWGRKMMDRKVPLRQMGEDPEDYGWCDYDEITSSIISHIRYDEKGNLKKEV